MARNQILVRWEPKDFDDVSQADLIRVQFGMWRSHGSCISSKKQLHENHKQPVTIYNFGFALSELKYNIAKKLIFPGNRINDFDRSCEPGFCTSTHERADNKTK